MTKEELIAAVTKRPLPFEHEGVTFYLLPIPWGELQAMQSKHKTGDTDTGLQANYEVIARSVCDEQGKLLLETSDCQLFPIGTITSLYKAVIRRAGIPTTDNNPGNSPAPTTS